MHNISPSFTSSSIIYGFVYLYYCTHSFTIPLFASCLSFVCFSLRKVHLPLQVTAFPTLFKTNHISFWVWLKEKISEMITILQVFCLFFAISFLVKVWFYLVTTAPGIPWDCQAHAQHQCLFARDISLVVVFLSGEKTIILEVSWRFFVLKASKFTRESIKRHVFVCVCGKYVSPSCEWWL